MAALRIFADEPTVAKDESARARHDRLGLGVRWIAGEGEHRRVRGNEARAHRSKILSVGDRQSFGHGRGAYQKLERTRRGRRELNLAAREPFEHFGG